MHFKYTVNDGKLNATANVTVLIRGPADNKAPETYPGYKPRTWTVPAGGHLQIPVTSDWRDFDGDPIGLIGATVKAGTVTTTPDGSLDYIAPGAGGTRTITYSVTDGIAHPVAGKVTVVVQAPTATNTVAPVTQPDMARGQVGQPITIHPLDNDLPGADPSDPSAKLQLAGDLASPAGTTVTTDLESGAVVVTAARARRVQPVLPGRVRQRALRQGRDPRRRGARPGRTPAAGGDARLGDAARPATGHGRRARQRLRPGRWCARGRARRAGPGDVAPAGRDHRRPLAAHQRERRHDLAAAAVRRLHDHRRAHQPGHRSRST